VTSAPWHRDVWMDAVWDSTLKPNERAVAYAFYRYAGNKKTSWCTWEELIRRTGIKSRNGVWLALKSLIELGWLEESEKARQHYSARYKLVIPPVQESPVGTPETSPTGTPEDPDVPHGDPDVPEMNSDVPLGDPTLLTHPSNTPFQPGGHAAPQTPLRGDDPSGHLTDSSDSPIQGGTDQNELATQPTTRARAENVVPIFSRTEAANRPCGKCGIYLEPDGTCFNCNRRHA